MDTLLDDIRTAIEAASGGAPTLAAELIGGCRPLLLVTATRDGEVTAHMELSAEGNLEQAASLAGALAQQLATAATCRRRLPGADADAWIVGARFSNPEGPRLLGCLLRHVPDEMPDDDLHNTRLLAAAAVWAAQHFRTANARVSTRISHLLAERDMLKASHAATLVAAIEEREARLREQEALHLQNQMILNSAGEGIVGLDPAGCAIFVNPAAARLLGYEIDELIGKPFHDTVHYAQADGTAYPLGNCPMAQQRAICGIANEVFWRKDGTSFPCEYTCTPIREGDAVTGAVITFSDISERRMLEAQLRQAQKLESIGQLAAGIAHEINTPTQYIGDNTRFLEDAFGNLSGLLAVVKQLGAARDPQAVLDLAVQLQASLAAADLDYLLEEIPRAIGQSLDGVDRVATIVRSMKEFSHPGSEEKQAIDLNRAIQSTLTVSRNEWKYVAEVVTDFDPQLPHVTCLPGDINQVILNLIVNAAHAIGDKLRGSTTEKGEIHIQTRQDGEWVEIRLRDTGTGIPKEIQSRIYDPFFTTKAVGRGTGQGLAIVHSVITERHHGTIRFETQPGQGTTFIIRLPLNDKSAGRGTV
jgi:PAS domain S-box-containing protein